MIKPGCLVKVKIFKDHTLEWLDQEPNVTIRFVRVLAYDATDHSFAILTGDYLTKDRGVEISHSTENTWKRLDYIFISMEPYRGQRMVWAPENHLKPDDLLADGEFCKVCKTFSPMSLPNQINGTFICYGCRTSQS